MRYPNLKYYFLVVAISINLIHGFIPHDHKHDPTALVFHTEETSNNLLDFLIHVFHFNPGQEHLENYRIIDSDFTFYDNSIDHAVHANVKKEEQNQEIKKINRRYFYIPIDPQEFCRQNILRGPPTIS